MRLWAPLALAVCLASVAAGQTTAPAELSKIAGWCGAAPNSAEAFRFVVLSDRTGQAVEGLWERAIDDVNALKGDFVMCIGDLVQGETDDGEEIRRQWEQFETLTRRLDAPFFYCPGNHDLMNDAMRRIYRERHAVDGRTYYSFDFRGCHFVVLDLMAGLHDAAFEAEQLDWLQADLDRSRDAAHTFVFHHSPLWTEDRLWPRLRAMLPAGKTTIFSGHWHHLGHRSEGGIETYVLAPTAGHTGTGGVKAGEFHMFAQVTVDQGQPTVALIPVGQVLPGSFAVGSADAQRVFEPDRRLGPKLARWLRRYGPAVGVTSLFWLGVVLIQRRRLRRGKRGTQDAT